MDVLLTDTSTGPARAAALRLGAAGHRVHTCHPERDPGFPCAAFRGEPCPLESYPIDVAVVVRAAAFTRPAPPEEGVLCAVRRDVPVVVAGAVEDNPFTHLAAAVHPGASVVEVVEAVADRPLQEASAAATAALRRALGATGAPVAGASAEVRRRGGRLAVSLEGGGAGRENVVASAPAVVRELRALDPWAAGVDVVLAG